MSATSTETVVPVQDEERCPQCARDFATCRCYDCIPIAFDVMPLELWMRAESEEA